ncbi:MAG: hypothetical protein QM759_06730 [Terricaulis sp.]
MKWLALLIILAGVAGYFTRPDEPKMHAAAEAVMNHPQDLGQAVGNVINDIGGERSYSNYYVAAKYTVGSAVTCWGAFTQVSCTRNASNATQTH